MGFQILPIYSRKSVGAQGRFPAVSPVISHGSPPAALKDTSHLLDLKGYELVHTKRFRNRNRIYLPLTNEVVGR